MPEFDFETQSEEVEPVELESVKRLIQLLSNTVKSLLIYPSNNPLPKEFKRKLHQGLSEFLDAHDELNLQVRPSQLLYGGKVVYEDGEKEEGVAFVLHKDGIRELAFLKGLEQEEVDDLVQVIETSLRSPDLEEDLVTMLWEKDLNHVKYLVVDDLLDVEVPSAEDIPDDWDFNQLFYSEVTLAEQDSTTPRTEQADLTLKQREEENRRLLERLKEFSPDEIDSIQKLLMMNSRYRSLDQFLNIMTEILLAEEDISEFEQVMDALEKITTTLISMADFHSATKVVREFKRFEEMMQKFSDGSDSLNNKKAERAKKAMDKAGEEENIKRISQVLNEKEAADLSSTKELLLSLNMNSISPIVHMLGDLNQFLSRKMVSEVLTIKAKDHLDLLGEGISDQRWYVVRNVVSVLGSIGSEKGVRFLKLIAKHQDLRIRKETVSSLFKIKGEQAGQLLASFLEDENKRIRILASRGLAQRKEKEALPELMNVLKHDQFKDKSPEEKKNMLESFAVIAGEEAVPFLVKMINKRSWLQRDKHNETRIFAVGALSMIDDPGVEEAINQLSRKRNKAIRQACQHALRRIEARRIREGEEAKVI